MPQIPFHTLDRHAPALKQALKQAADRVIDRGHYILGPELERFEERWAAHCGVRRAVGCGSGLDALYIALKALGIGPGDEVLVSAHTFIATIFSILRTGADPVLVDADPQTFNLNPEQARAKTTPRTRACVVVHLYGVPAKVDSFTPFLEARGIPLVEDYSQAQGAFYAGKACGSLGPINAASLYPIKNLGALGDGGIITTNVDRFTLLAKKCRNYGSVEKHHHEFPGLNSRLDELQAAFLNAKLDFFQELLTEKERQAAYYAQALAGIGDISTQVVPPGAQPARHIFAIRSQYRDALRQFLAEQGIGTQIHYPTPPHRQPALRGLNYQAGQLPVAEDLAATLLSLPLFPGLQEEEQAQVVDAIRAFFER